MNHLNELLEHYRIIRERLRNPPNAVPDTGINLKRPKQPKQTKEVTELVLALPVVSSYSTGNPYETKYLTFRSTLDFVANEFGLSGADIRSVCRKNRVVIPRQIAIWLAWTNKIQSFSGMGRYLHKDHTTILSGYKKIDRKIKGSDTLAQRVQDIEARLLATHIRPAFSPICKPLLGRKKKQQNGNTRADAIITIFTVDNSGRPTFCDAEKESRQPDVDGELPCPTRAIHNGW